MVFPEIGRGGWQNTTMTNETDRLKKHLLAKEKKDTKTMMMTATAKEKEDNKNNTTITTTLQKKSILTQ